MPRRFLLTFMIALAAMSIAPSVASANIPKLLRASIEQNCGNVHANITNQTQLRTMMYCMVDRTRAHYKLPALARTTFLANTSSAKANKIISCGGKLTHYPCGQSLESIFKSYGAGAGENLAVGAYVGDSAYQIWRAWIFSTKGHRQNMLTKRWRAHGIQVLPNARIDGVRAPLWVHHFGAKR